MHKVIIFSEYFIPAFLAGGPPKSASNIVKFMKDKIKFEIYTSNYDLRNTTKLKVKNNQSLKFLNKNKIIYNSTLGYFFNFNKLNFSQVRTFYLNSFFSIKWCLLPLLIAIYKEKKVVISPRGQFHKTSISQKKIKKKLFMFFFKFFLNKNICFHVTDKNEYLQIKKFYKYANIKIIPNFFFPIKTKANLKKNKQFIFIGRITRKKNLLFFFSSLKKHKIKNFNLDLFGPIEDFNYWNDCKKEIDLLNRNNNKIIYRGSLNNKEINKILSKYNFFVLPSTSENFSLTTAEAINNKCIPIITKNSPWKSIEDANCGIRFNPNSDKEISFSIKKALNMKIKKIIKLQNRCVVLIKNIDKQNKLLIEQYFKILSK